MGAKRQLTGKRRRVHENKTRKHQEKVIFVFYTFAQGGSWTYNKLPSGWWWVGSGSTVPTVPGNASEKYKREEQFQGPAVTQEKTMLYLDKVFTKLKKDGVISMFKLRKSYLP
jgi:GH24 family phage-related lysozyme (muramidase)